MMCQLASGDQPEVERVGYLHQTHPCEGSSMLSALTTLGDILLMLRLFDGLRGYR